MSIYFFYDDADVPFRYMSPTLQLGPIPVPRQGCIVAADYLEFARQDFAADAPARGRINAVTNARRAFRLAVDGVLHQFGLFARFRCVGIDEKLRLLDAIGVLPVGILHALPVLPDLGDDDYTVPTRARAKAVVDAAQILLLTLEGHTAQVPHEVVVGWREPPRHVLMQIEPQAGELRLFGIVAHRNHYTTIRGVRCLAPIREGSRLVPGVRVARRPWKTMLLDREHEGQWLPIVRELVAVQRRQSSHRPDVDPVRRTVSMRVTLPLSVSPGAWHDVLGAALAKGTRRHAACSRC